MRHLFSTLSGNEHGKLTTIPQKCTVLAAIGNCAPIATTLSSDTFASIVQLFTDYLKSESSTPQEQTLVCALTQLNTWLSVAGKVKANDAVQKRLDELFKALLVDSKPLATMHQIRSAVYHCMATVFTAIPSLLSSGGSTFGALFATGCVQVVDKAAAQNTLLQASHNCSLTAEALAAARVLTIFLTVTGDLTSGKNSNLRTVTHIQEARFFL